MVARRVRVRDATGMRALLLATALLLLVAPAASADALVQAPPKRITTNDCLTLKVRYDEGTGAPRTVRVTLAVGLSVEKQVTLRSTSRWRTHRLLCRPGTGRWEVTAKQGETQRRTFTVRVVRP